MREGTTEKSRVEKETVRALLVANGAGAVAMLALLPAVLDRIGYQPLARGLLFGLLVMMLGVVLAIAHNHLRGRIAPAIEPQPARPQQSNLGSQQHNPGQHNPGSQQHNLGQQGMRPPAVVETKAPTSRLNLASTVCMWLSVVAFLGAGTFVAMSGLQTLDGFQNRGASQPTSTVGDQKAKQKAR